MTIPSGWAWWAFCAVRARAMGAGRDAEQQAEPPAAERGEPAAWSRPARPRVLRVRLEEFDDRVAVAAEEQVVVVEGAVGSADAFLLALLEARGSADVEYSLRDRAGSFAHSFVGALAAAAHEDGVMLMDEDLLPEDGEASAGRVFAALEARAPVLADDVLRGWGTLAPARGCLVGRRGNSKH